ncbi:class I SAM-dependent methyltransferase [uncultured Clostridium sp.]|jgi:SAM-dependent methyltransferase|uniref:class I SAM-dependent methyltransferase n=1 Tax=Clostridium sp. TaxID=1506 RepID=UPI0034343A85|nr:class I SAM-dependent methyltransferase [Clostridium sp.]
MNKTLNYYNNNSKEYIEKTLQGNTNNLCNNFLNNIKKGGKILDLGCGSGRDSLEFIKRGYKITAVDGSKEIASRSSKIIGQPVIYSKFEDLKLEEKFDGIWACASLLHVNRKDIINVIKNISLNLKEDGVFYMSFKYGEDEYIDENERYFNCYTEKTFKEMIERVKNLKIKEIYITGDTLGGRENLRWLNILLEA